MTWQHQFEYLDVHRTAYKQKRKPPALVILQLGAQLGYRVLRRLSSLAFLLQLRKQMFRRVGGFLMLLRQLRLVERTCARARGAHTQEYSQCAAKQSPAIPGAAHCSGRDRPPTAGVDRNQQASK